MNEFMNQDLITHTTWMHVIENLASLAFSLLALMFVRFLVYLDYKNPNDWKNMAKKNGDFKSISNYHCCVFFGAAFLLTFLHF